MGVSQHAAIERDVGDASHGKISNELNQICMILRSEVRSINRRCRELLVQEKIQNLAWCCEALWLRDF
ncbi:hypothetical protein RB938 [Rhodopirellula baltica SH 1]|uniref:Uncharacterized protein n=1 Tax=Rhodopirellula baltica (strain DSM 10527 / NCIMB 13988 / SH1) TaxID=243090 RepID=Q7UY19_RHOBA|nr:hypothetical protein RB938 [Rhodopirellula baltica SH 1]